MEYKGFDFDIKGLEDTGEFKGYASTFGNEDEGGDIVVVGAFTKTLRKSDGKVPIFADHNIHNQIGWGLEGVEDGKGLKVKGALDLTIPAAMHKHSLAKKAKEIGAKMGLSIGYNVVKSDWQGDVRLLKEVQLVEYSITAVPMNTRATITGLKHLLSPSGEPIADVRSFENALRDVGFSKHKAKAIASFAFNISGRSDDGGIEDAEAKSLVEAISKLTATIKIKEETEYGPD